MDRMTRGVMVCAVKLFVPSIPTPGIVDRVEVKHTLILNPKNSLPKNTLLNDAGEQMPLLMLGDRVADQILK